MTNDLQNESTFIAQCVGLNSYERAMRRKKAEDALMLLSEALEEADARIERLSDEVMELKATLTDYRDSGLKPIECAELVRAKGEGRLVVLPSDFPQDMGNLLEPLKLESALRSEMFKIEYRLKHKPQDVSVLDYTILAALKKCLEDAVEIEAALRKWERGEKG